jgi:hypothetical protein
MKRRLGIIGGGTAGIMSLCHFLTYLDSEWEVVLVYDPTADIFDAPTSATPGFVSVLERAFNFSLLDTLEPLNATLKFGSIWKNWRQQTFNLPNIGGNAAIHFDSLKFRDYVLPKLEEHWPNKFKSITGHLDSLTNKETHVSAVVNGVEHVFNYAMDCRGAPNDWADYEVLTDMPVNHSFVHSKKSPGDWTYSGQNATPYGWMFEIPLGDRQCYGYHYNDNITSKEDALANFAEIINVPVEELTVTEYQYKSYYANKVFDGRIMKNGNRAVFFEPISANSVYIFDQANRIFYAYLANNIKTPEIVNREFVKVANDLRELICYYYHGGSIYDTKFWDYAKEVTGNVIRKSETIKEISSQCKNWVDKQAPVYAPTWFFTGIQLYHLDKNFGYGYFSQ